MEKVEISRVFKCKPQVIYDNWLSSKGHSEIIGANANISDQEGDEFNMWDEYITGKNVKLVPYSQINQLWRTSEFNSDDPDSILSITLREVQEGCEFNMVHTHIPKGQTQYLNGWLDNYLIPMAELFGVIKRG
jgi:activator of HSP90 ATPase